MCQDGKGHEIHSYPETLPDGSVRPVVYCVKCGMEWR